MSSPRYSDQLSDRPAGWNENASPTRKQFKRPLGTHPMTKKKFAPEMKKRFKLGTLLSRNRVAVTRAALRALRKLYPEYCENTGRDLSIHPLTYQVWWYAEDVQIKHYYIELEVAHVSTNT